MGMRYTKLSESEISGLSASLPGWTRLHGRPAIGRSFTFKSFREAFAFMTEVALWAEKTDHHPEWTNVWNRVDIVLTTHAAHALTTHDTQLAERIDEAAARFSQAGA